MNQFPQRWTRSAEAAVLEQRLRSAPRSVLMLDYDGTLAPFHVDRFEATPYSGVEERLSILSALSQVRLVLVSGRSVNFTICCVPISGRKSGGAMAGND
jgi:trehalose 6-phosphate phosphatase